MPSYCRVGHVNPFFFVALHDPGYRTLKQGGPQLLYAQASANRVVYTSGPSGQFLYALFCGFDFQLQWPVIVPMGQGSEQLFYVCFVGIISSIEASSSALFCQSDIFVTDWISPVILR